MAKPKKNIFYRITESPIFQRFIIGVIVFAAILVGIETYPNLYHTYSHFLHWTNLAVQAVFTIEIIMRILAYGNKPLNFFKSGMNNFDFIITALFYVPFGGPYASVLRLIRIFRVFRLITALPRLQLLVGALIKSVPSMGYISLLMVIQMYIFAVLGNFLFGKHDPFHFGDLGTSMLTLFKIITLEGWIEIMESQPQTISTPIYFISFILIGTMIVLNLFIGVIMNGFEEVKREIDTELINKNKKASLKAELAQISSQMDELKVKLDNLAAKRK